MLNGWGAAAVVLLFIAVLLLVAGLQHHLTSLAPGPVDMPHLATKDNSDIAFSPFEKSLTESASLALPTSTFSTAPASVAAKHRVICTVLKNEARFVKEWVEFHHDVGFDKIRIYDDDSSDNLLGVLSTISSNYFEYRKVNWTYHKRSRHIQTDLQREVLSKCFVRYFYFLFLRVKKLTFSSRMIFGLTQI